MQLLSQVFSIKMLYRQLITITLSIYKNFSLGLVVISWYRRVLRGKLFSNGTMLPAQRMRPQPADTLVM